MRTTLNLDDWLAREVEKRAAETGRSFEEVVNEALARGLSLRPAAPPQPYRLPTFSMGRVREGVDLTKALEIAAALEDGERGAI